MRADMLNDLHKRDDRFFANWAEMYRGEGLGISSFMVEAPMIILQTRESDEDETILMPYTQRLAAAAEGDVAPAFEYAEINTFPFGLPTTEMFPEFLGICAGETSFKDALKAVCSYCEKAKNIPPRDQPKTVMLLTDKWDGPIFHKDFELDLLRYALENNILFIFLLVTDYGMTGIPFFARSHVELDELRRRNYEIEKEDTGVAALKALRRFPPCTYERHSGTWAQYGSAYCEDAHYRFDFHAMRCEIEAPGQETRIKKIPKPAARKFAAVFYAFQGQPGQVYTDTRAFDAGCCRAQVFDVCFEWYEIGTDAPAQPYKKISRAFINLINSLEG